MTSRRQFLLAGALGAIAPACLAQKRPSKVCALAPRPLSESSYAPGVVKALEELGFRHGSTMTLDYRSADGRIDRYPTLALELIGQKCDLVVTFGIAPSVPFRDARYPVPLVFLAIEGDPVESKLVAGLRNPGVNATGVYIPQGAMVAKRLEVMREAAPGLRRVLVFADAATRAALPSVRKAAEQAGTQLTVIEFSKHPYDYEGAFAEGRKAQAGALMTLQSPVFSTDRNAIAALVAKHGLLSVGSTAQYTEAGFLFSMNVDAAKMTRRVAEMGVRILRGAKPADIPVEQADEYELIVNMKTAKTLGVKVPYSVLARVTRMIE